MEKYQTFTPRLFALIIDALIFFPLYFLDNWIKYEVNSVPAILALWLLVSTAMHPVYSILMHGLYGQTLGKMAMKVKVVDAFEKPITFHHALLRELPYLSFTFSSIFFTMSQSFNSVEAPGFLPSAGDIILSLMIVWSIADIAVLFISDKRRSLHDFIAGTVVIRTNV
jgi:uncharacterized RDD family membrane protein YckC